MLSLFCNIIELDFLKTCLEYCSLRVNTVDQWLKINAELLR